MKRVSLGCMGALGLFIAILALPCVLHDLGLHRFKVNFAQVAHPSASAALHDLSAVGLLEGNGDHCDYLAGQFRESNLTHEEIIRFYANSRVRRVDPKAYDSGFGDYVPIYIDFPDTHSSDISNLIDDSTLATVHAKRTLKTLYLVYSIDAGYDPNFDLRCF